VYVNPIYLLNYGHIFGRFVLKQSKTKNINIYIIKT